MDPIYCKNILNFRPLFFSRRLRINHSEGVILHGLRPRRITPRDNTLLDLHNSS